jgi:hypothetical protein
MTGWRLITELHPNRDPDNLVLLAHFNEPPHEGPPDYVTLASWGTVMPVYTDGYIECASYSGWYCSGVPTVGKPWEWTANCPGFLPTDPAYAPTHWMPLP